MEVSWIDLVACRISFISILTASLMKKVSLRFSPTIEFTFFFIVSKLVSIHGNHMEGSSICSAEITMLYLEENVHIFLLEMLRINIFLCWERESSLWFIKSCFKTYSAKNNPSLNSASNFANKKETSLLHVRRPFSSRLSFVVCIWFKHSTKPLRLP